MSGGQRASGSSDDSAQVTVLQPALDGLHERELRYRELLDALPAAIYTTDAQGRITFYNAACLDFSGRRPELGTGSWCVSWRLYHADGAPMRHDQCPMAVALRENRPIRGEEAVAERPDGTRVPFVPYPTPLHDADGSLIGAVNLLVDISGRKESEERLKQLSHQVNHRANNLLAVVQATLRLTEAATVDDFKKILEGRIHALGRAHSMVARSQWVGVDLRELVTLELSAHLDAEIPRVWASGPALPLSPDAAQAMALAIHELASNATRHGALSASEGVVHVSWRRDDAGSLHFRWIESGGPAVTPPARRGVGVLMIERAVRQLGGEVRLDWAPGGLACEIVSDD